MQVAADAAMAGIALLVAAHLCHGRIVGSGVILDWDLCGHPAHCVCTPAYRHESSCEAAIIAISENLSMPMATYT